MPRRGDLAHPDLHPGGRAVLLPAADHGVSTARAAVEELAGWVHDLGRELRVKPVADVCTDNGAG